MGALQPQSGTPPSEFHGGLLVLIPVPSQITLTNMAFNHTGDGIVLNNSGDPSIRLIDYSLDMPSEMNKGYGVAAHVDGCVTVAFDPRGKCVRLCCTSSPPAHQWRVRDRYLATGGNDSIVNLFDTSEWVCARTITSCEYVVYPIAPNDALTLHLQLWHHGDQFLA